MINIPVQTDGRHHDRAHEWLGIRSGSQQNDITDRLDYNGPTTRAAIQADAGGRSVCANADPVSTD